MRGGYRPGAGRPPKAGTSKAPVAPVDVVEVAAKVELSPLDYMLRVMNDEKAEPERRDRMAIAAAPFVHVRPADRKPGKKEEAAARAREVTGTDWDELLPTDRPPPRFKPSAPPRIARIDHNN